MHSSLKSLIMVANQEGVGLNMKTLLQVYNIGNDELEDRQLLKIANENGLKAKQVTFDWDKLSKLKGTLPVILKLKQGPSVILTNVALDDDGCPKEVTIVDPGNATPSQEKIDRAKLEGQWGGKIIFLKKRYDLDDVERTFDAGWLWGQYMRHKSLAVQLVLISLVLHAFALLPIIFIMIVLDKVVNFQAMSTLYVLSIGVIVAYLFNGVLGYIRQYIILFVSSKVDAHLNAQIFDRLLSQSLRFFQRRSQSEISGIMQRTTALRQALAGRFISSILDSTALIVFVPVLFFYSPMLGGIVLLFAAAIAGNGILSARVQAERRKQTNDARIKKQNIMSDTIRGAATVKTLSLENTRKQEWEDAVTNHTIHQLKLGQLTSIFKESGSTLQQLMTVAVIFVGVLLVFNDGLSPGVLIGANMLAGKITGPLVQLVTMMADLQGIKQSIEAIGTIMNAKTERVGKGRTPELSGQISFNNVNFSYKEGEPVLRNFSLDIKPQENVAIVGVAGSGKSTIASLIQGFIKADSGTVEIDGDNVRNINSHHLRSNVSLVTQTPQFFKGTIRDNVLMPYPNVGTPRLLWAAGLSGLEKEVENLADGFETEMVASGGNLSTGMRQQIALARSLLRNPSVLLLDEVATNLDQDEELAMREQFPKVAVGRTVLSFTHKVSSAMLCDRIIVLDRGRIVEEGTHEELIASGAHYTQMWSKELELAGLNAATIDKYLETSSGQETKVVA